MKNLTVIYISLTIAILAMFFYLLHKNKPDQHSGSIGLPDGVDFQYRLFKPGNISEKAPLLLILHGLGERGFDNEKPVKKISGRVISKITKNYNAWVLIPQCPPDRYWVVHPKRNFDNYNLAEFKDTDILEAIENLVHKTVKENNIDPKRIYVAGHSMGGLGTWKILYDNPELFAAAIPASVGCDPGSAEVFRKVALWLVVGEKDPYFSASQINEMYLALGKVSLSEVRFTVLEEKGHDLFRFILNNKEMMDWMFSKRKD